MRELLEVYSERATPRAARDIYRAASEDALTVSPYEPMSLTRTSTRRSAIAIAVLAATMALGAAVLQFRGTDRSSVATGGTVLAPSEASVPPDAPSQLSIDDVEAAPGYRPIMIDATTDRVGYYKTEEGRSETVVEVFAFPSDGDVIGYSVSWVGFIDAEAVRSPGFDLEAFARSRFGDEKVDGALARNGRLDEAGVELERLAGRQP